jgi:hypothetical protein
MKVSNTSNPNGSGERMNRNSSRIERNVVPTTEFQVFFNKELDRMGLKLSDLVEITGTTYEAVRRYARGLQIPHPTVLKLMAAKFNWNSKAVEAMAIRDRQRIKYGGMVDVASDKDPDVQKFALSWPLLSGKQKEILVQLLTGFLSE